MKRYPINRDWQFCENNDGFAFTFAKHEYEAVDLPHDFIVTKPRSPEAPGGPGNGFFGDGQGTYKKTLDIPAEWKGKRVVLDIDGAYMNAEVALNGELLALHPYGYTPFLVDLTDALRWDGPNRLKVITQSRQPSTRWYSGGGLYRGVSLWVGDPVHIGPWDVFVTTPEVEPGRAQVQADISVTNASDKGCVYTVRTQVADGAGNAVVQAEDTLELPAGAKSQLVIKMPVNSPALWDLDTPNLYTLHTWVLVDGEVRDETETSFGIRKIEVDTENGLRLNGRELKLKGGCIHHDNGFLGAAAYPRAEERKIEILKAAGYNAVRISHYPPSLAMLEACDRLGMLLLDEAFDVWRESKVPLDYHLYFEDWWERDLTSMVLRDRNHPCVITYSIGNEIGERDGGSDGAAWSRRLSDKLRSLDNTRFVLSAICNVFGVSEDDDSDLSNFDANLALAQDEEDTWGASTAAYAEPLDIVGYNYLYMRYAQDAEKFPGRVICGTETMAFTTYENWQAVLENKHVIGDFIWTAYDNLGEVGVGRVMWQGEETPGFFGPYPWRSCFQGDHDLCGQRNPQSYYRQIMWGDSVQPALFTTHPSRYGKTFSGTGWHWYDVQDSWTFDEQYLGKPVKVDAYTAGDEVEFLLGGKSLGRVKADKLIATMDIPYAPGNLEAVAYKAGKEQGRTALVSAGSPAAVRLRADRDRIAADSLDLGFIDIEIVDKDGNRVPWAGQKLTCRVSAPGGLAGIGSGDPKSEDPFGAGWCTAYRGRATAAVKAAAPGTVIVTVEAEGVGAASCEITAE